MIQIMKVGLKKLKNWQNRKGSSAIPAGVKFFQYSIFWFLFTISTFFGQANTYLGPKAPVAGNPQLVRIEVLIQDSLELAGLTIVSASFNQTDIPIKPRDVNGYRGGASFQLPPGEYPLRWVVQRDKSFWPRRITHKEIVTISPKDMWIQIKINGDQASID